MPKFKITVSTNKIGSGMSKIVSVDDLECGSLQPSEREEYLQELEEQTLWELINIDTKEIG